jgi:hypothetical protein
VFGVRHGVSFEALRLLWSLRGCSIMLVAPPHEMVQSEGDFVGMHRTPGDDALQLDAIIDHRADLHEFGFDDFCVPHIHFSIPERTSKMVGKCWDKAGIYSDGRFPRTLSPERKN